MRYYNVKKLIANKKLWAKNARTLFLVYRGTKLYFCILYYYNFFPRGRHDLIIKLTVRITENVCIQLP